MTPSGADIGTSGDRLTIPFWGTGRPDLAVRRGDYRAFLYASCSMANRPMPCPGTLTAMRTWSSMIR